MPSGTTSRPVDRIPGYPAREVANSVARGDKMEKEKYEAPKIKTETIEPETLFCYGSPGSVIKKK